MFGVTLAESKILRHLAAGDRVGTIAAETGRSEGTVRTQLNALMQKTGIHSQRDLLRLVSLLLQSTDSLEQPTHSSDLHQHSPPSVMAENVFQHISLLDGRTLDYTSIGDPQGRPFLWLMSQIGLARWHRDAERVLGEKGLHMIVPVRAGYGHSSQPPLDRPILDVAVDDTFQLMDKLNIVRCPVIAPADDFRIALMMAQQKPDRISHLFADAAGFPIATPEHYRRLHPIARFFRANARYVPDSLPFVFKVMRAMIRRQGVSTYIRKSLSHFPIDQTVFADPAVSDAMVAGFQLLIGPDTHCERAYGSEVVSLLATWPVELGDVDCPVTLFHGEHDGNSASDTVREYASSYPKWELLIYPDEGQLILYSKWQQVLARLEEAVSD
jgi:pimeloyl-ACP methyl ester carboxylesterase/DNA-binding CsgD family transcriptional regulator